MRKIFACLGALALILAPGMSAAFGHVGPQEDFGNAGIIELAQVGVGDDVLLAKIASLPCSYDVSIASIVALKKAGVSDAVIASMVQRCAGASGAQGAVAEDSDPKARRSPGIYLDLGTDGAHRLIKMRPTGVSGGRSTGNGSILFPFRVISAIPRASAQLSAESDAPHFYFYFETDNAQVGEFGTSATASAQSPAEFNLVRFREKNGQREMVVAKQKLFGANIGIDPKDSVQISVEDVADGIFAVTTLGALKPGEYGFVLRAGSDDYRVYDFRVP